MAVDAELAQILPPHDNGAETSLIGCILRSDVGFPEAGREVTSDEFYSYAHKLIWASFKRLSLDGKPFDPGLVWRDLEAGKHGVDVGGPGYLVSLFRDAPSDATRAVYFAKIVRQKAMLRRIIQAAREMESAALDVQADADEIAGRAADIVFGLTEKNETKTVDWETAIQESLLVLDRRAGNGLHGESDDGLKTGWPTLDKFTGGLHRKELVILAARPSVGKTLAALNVIDAIASEGAAIFFASLEQGTTELVHRILSKRSGMNSHKFRTGRFEPLERDAVLKVADDTKGHRLWINDGAGQPLSQVVAEARRIKMRFGLDMVVVDYLGLMDGERDRRSATRTEEIGRLTRGLKRLAKDLDVVVLCLAQLNRGPENRPGGRPRLSDLRDSGEIEQDADTVFMLHKPEAKDTHREKDQLDWLIEKQRNGPCGEVAMVHYKKTFEIRELIHGAAPSI